MRLLRAFAPAPHHCTLNIWYINQTLTPACRFNPQIFVLPAPTIIDAGIPGNAYTKQKETVRQATPETVRQVKRRSVPAHEVVTVKITVES